MNRQTFNGSCHCGALRFTCDIDLAHGTSRCNCSMCVKTRLWKALALPGTFRLLQGDDALATYRFGSRRVEHRFCRHCGVKIDGPWRRRRISGSLRRRQHRLPRRHAGRREGRPRRRLSSVTDATTIGATRPRRSALSSVGRGHCTRIARSRPRVASLPDQSFATMRKV